MYFLETLLTPYRNMVLLVAAISLVFYRARRGDSLLLVCAYVSAAFEVGFVLFFLIIEQMRDLTEALAGTVGSMLNWSVHRMAHAYEVGDIVYGATVGIVAWLSTTVWNRFFSAKRDDELKLKVLYWLPVVGGMLIGLFGERYGPTLFFVLHGWLTIVFTSIWWCSRARFKRRVVIRTSLVAILFGMGVLIAVAVPGLLRAHVG